MITRTLAEIEAEGLRNTVAPLNAIDRKFIRECEARVRAARAEWRVVKAAGDPLKGTRPAEEAQAAADIEAYREVL